MNQSGSDSKKPTRKSPPACARFADSSGYRPDIDGLRALAVLSVMLFHAGLGCRGGYVGVDVFFVISGYLISSLILKELGVGSFSLISFWERRIRRIFPALTVVVFATVVVAWITYLPRDLSDAGKSVVGQGFVPFRDHRRRCHCIARIVCLQQLFDSRSCLLPVADAGMGIDVGRLAGDNARKTVRQHTAPGNGRMAWPGPRVLCGAFL